jgi:hypothetical protein
MSITLDVGQVEQFTITSTRPIPAGAVTVAGQNPAAVTVVINPEGAGSITALATGSTSATFSAPGFSPVSVLITVNPLPQLVFTPGAIA